METVELYFDLSPDGQYNPELLECDIEDGRSGEIVCRSAEHGVFIKFPAPPKDVDRDEYIALMAKRHNEANNRV